MNQAPKLTGQPAPLIGIHDEIDQLERQLTHVRDGLGDLFSRLTPVLRPSPPKGEPGSNVAPVAIRSPHSDRLWSVTADLVGLNERINEVLERLDV